MSDQDLQKQEAAEDQAYHNKITSQQRETPLATPAIPAVPEVPKIPEIPKIGGNTPTAPRREQAPETDEAPEAAVRPAKYDASSDHHESPLPNPESTERAQHVRDEHARNDAKIHGESLRTPLRELAAQSKGLSSSQRKSTAPKPATLRNSPVSSDSNGTPRANFEQSVVEKDSEGKPKVDFDAAGRAALAASNTKEASFASPTRVSMRDAVAGKSLSKY
jgi:hypothetical protein